MVGGSRRRGVGRRLLMAGLAVGALVAAACAAGTNFPSPSDPVSAIPWPDYELLRYDIIDQTGETLGTVDFEVERVGAEYRLRILFLLSGGEARDEVLLAVRADTLQPLRYERLAVAPGRRLEAEGRYGRDEEGEPILESVVIEDGEREEERLRIGDSAFDTDSSAWLWRSVAFATDLELTYRSVNVRVQRSQLVRLRVVGQDMLRTPVGTVLAWQLEARPGLERQNVWYQVDPPHLLLRWDLEPLRYLLREVHNERAAEAAASRE